MRPALLLALAVLAACSTSGSTSSDRSDPLAFGIPAGVGPVTEYHRSGGTVWVYDVAVYGPCDLIEPHKASLATWLNIPPPDGYTDYGMVCK